MSDDGLVDPGSIWTRVEEVASTGSTNADVRARAVGGADEGLVLSADEQTAGRGRLGRRWTAPPGSGLAVSVLLRPSARPAAQGGGMPLLVGLAAVDAVDAVVEGTRLPVGLKWPNDVMIGECKVGGVLVERVETGLGPAAVAGLGLNVSMEEPQLPVPTATSLLAEGATVDRRALLRAYLASLDSRYRAWRAGGSPREEYRQRCSTLGRDIRVLLPGDAPDVVGVAADVDESGRLIVVVANGSRVALSSGEVQHVR